MTTLLNMPDVEALVWERVKDLGGMHVFAYDAQAGWPFVTDTVSVQLDCRASSKKNARDRVYRARNVVLGLPFDPTCPQVAACNIVSGPSWLPEQDGAPRYVLRVSVTVRGDRA